MLTLEKKRAVLNAVERVRSGEYKATALKIEFEAMFNRKHGSSGCEDCDDGWTECGECNGNYEDFCDCDSCGGTGYLRLIDGNYLSCADNDEGAVQCEDCCGSGRDYCPDCEEGRVRCEDCESGEDISESRKKWANEAYCHDWLMGKLAKIGLAQKLPDGETLGLPHSLISVHYKPIGALKYAEFYHDGSVDSEFTVTISLKNRNNIFLVPQIAEIFKSLGKAIGNEISTERAGMHMALINHSKFLYGRGHNTKTENSVIRYDNFKRSMTLLLPTLYFLASQDHVSRGMRFREPCVGSADNQDGNGKYSAINYSFGAIEFRAFETCYGEPERILDNFVVMANCMRYWTKVFTPCGLEKRVKSIRFGNDTNHELDRLYSTVEHLDLLNAGLMKLKPSYMSLKECKLQRQFKTNKGTIKRTIRKVVKEAEAEYPEYDKCYDWHMEINRKHVEGRLLEEEMARFGRVSDVNLEEVDKNIVKEAKRLIAEEANKKLPLAKFVEDKVKNYNERVEGKWELSVPDIPDYPTPRPPVSTEAAYHFDGFTVYTTGLGGF